MKGFNIGVIIVQNRETALPIGKVADGHRYTNMQGTKTMATAMMWDTYVKRDFHLASKLCVLRE